MTAPLAKHNVCKTSMGDRRTMLISWYVFCSGFGFLAGSLLK